jgi:DNA end-binding protein Ku
MASEKQSRSVGGGSICFGLVSIPFRLYTATSAEKVEFNLLHEKCGNRVKSQPYRCPACDVELDKTEIVRGHEYEKNRYVLIRDEELKSLAGEASESMEILEFVPLAAVDPIYYEKTYYVGPDKGGDKAYQLLSAAMRQSQRMAVAKFVMRGKENIVLLRPTASGLMMHTMFFADEIRAFAWPSPLKLSNTESELALRLIEELSTKAFEPEKYSDEYRDRVLALIEKKARGETITLAEPVPRAAPVVDLVEALKSSLGKRKTAVSAKPAVAAAKKVAKSK